MKIIINGKEQETACQTAFQVRDSIGNPDDIVILNGFQIAQDAPLSEDDNLSIIRKGVMPNQDELESMMMARHTPHVHQQGKKSKSRHRRIRRPWLQYCRDASKNWRGSPSISRL